MSDTQWRRYQVFVQEAEGKPHLDYGSVHAPDPELALLNARDVFARRPECISMWVVPVEAVYTFTTETVKDRKFFEPFNDQTSPESYCVFTKSRQTGTMSFTGEIMAYSPFDALKKSLMGMNKDKPVLFWWIFLERMAVKSDLRDADSYYAPAREKNFRLSMDFHTVTDMKKIKHSAGRGTE